MSNIKNIQKIKNIKKETPNKSKNIFPLIGTPNQLKQTKETNNYKNEEQVNIELKGKEPSPSKLNLNQIKNIDSQNLIVNEKTRNNYKLINSRNINNEIKFNPINKTNNNKSINAEIINEIGKTEVKQNKLIQKVYKIIFVFRNEDFYLSVKGNTTINNLRISISKLINLDIKQIAMIYEDKEIETKNDYKTVNNYFNFNQLRSRPIIFIKKKFISNNISEEGYSNNYLFKKIYNNKVKITNFPSNGEDFIKIEEKINNIVINFFKNNLKNGDDPKNENNQYKIENSEEKNNNNSYIIAFPSQDLAFDFNRYFSSLKLINPLYKDTKSNIICMKKKVSENKIKLNSKNDSPKGHLRYGIDYNLEENNLKKRNSNFLKLIRKNYLQRKELKKEKNNSQIYVNVSGPYLSSFEKERLEEKENKKKWINPEGFIACVGKYSGKKL